jgi:hypothetical protein
MNAGPSIAPRTSAASPCPAAALADKAANDRNATAVTLPARLAVRGRHRPLSVEVSRDAVTVRPLAEAGPAVVDCEPLTSYRGVAVRVERGEAEPMFHLSLFHDDATRAVPLAASADAAAVARLWQAWAKALSLPLLAVDTDGTVSAELTAIGVVLAERPSPRRRGSALVGRRSPFGRRRRAMARPRPLGEMPVFSGEREIIART